MPRAIDVVVDALDAVPVDLHWSIRAGQSVHTPRGLAAVATIETCSSWLGMTDRKTHPSADARERPEVAVPMAIRTFHAQSRPVSMSIRSTSQEFKESRRLHRIQVEPGSRHAPRFKAWR